METRRHADEVCSGISMSPHFLVSLSCIFPRSALTNVPLTWFNARRIHWKRLCEYTNCQRYQGECRPN
jgi:hypothetical protein